jgi:hypothetical protein
MAAAVRRHSAELGIGKPTRESDICDNFCPPNSNSINIANSPIPTHPRFSLAFRYPARAYRIRSLQKLPRLYLLNPIH